MAQETRIKIEDADRGYAFELIQQSISTHIAVQYIKNTYRDGKLLNTSNETVNININGSLENRDMVDQLLKQDPRALDIAGLAMEKMAEGYVFEPAADPTTQVETIEAVEPETAQKSRK